MFGKGDVQMTSRACATKRLKHRCVAFLTCKKKKRVLFTPGQKSSLCSGGASLWLASTLHSHATEHYSPLLFSAPQPPSAPPPPSPFSFFHFLRYCDVGNGHSTAEAGLTERFARRARRVKEVEGGERRTYRSRRLVVLSH